MKDNKQLSLPLACGSESLNKTTTLTTRLWSSLTTLLDQPTSGSVTDKEVAYITNNVTAMILEAISDFYQ